MNKCFLGLVLMIGVVSGSVAQTSSTDIDRVVAIVNTEVVTLGELNSRLDVVSRQMRRQRVEPPPADILRQQVLERIVLDKAQLQAARDVGIRIDEAMLDRAINGIAQQNRLSPQELKTQVEREGRSFDAFREDIRIEMSLARLREREVDNRLQISEADIDVALSEAGGAPLDEIEFNLAAILLRVNENASAEEVARQKFRAEELLKQAQRGTDFARMASSFSDAPDAASGGAMGWRKADRLPTIFVSAVASLKPGEVALARSPAGFHVLKLVDRKDPVNKGLSNAPVKQTRARHILIRVNEIVTDSDAQRRLREIRQRVESKTADFATLARQFSADGSASNGGDLGWIYAGDTVPEFERAMDELGAGEMSQPVRSVFGWHLIQVLDRRTDEASPERMRNLARQSLRERRSEEVYQEWLRELRDRTFVELRLE